MADNLRAIFHGGLRVEPPLLKYREQPRFRVASQDLVLCASGLTPNLDLCYAAVLGPITPAEFFAQANAFFPDEQPYAVILEAGVSDLARAGVACGRRHAQYGALAAPDHNSPTTPRPHDQVCGDQDGT